MVVERPCPFPGKISALIISLFMAYIARQRTKRSIFAIVLLLRSQVEINQVSSLLHLLE